MFAGHAIVRHAAVLVLCLCAGAGMAQQRPINKAWADSVAEALNGNAIEDYEATLPLARRVYAFYEQRKDTCGMAELRVAMGSCYDALGVLDSALYVLLQAARWSERGCTAELPYRVALNLGAVYLSLGEFARTDSVCREALARAERDGGSVHETDLLFNQAVAMASMGDLPGAEEVFRELERLGRERDLPDLEIDAMLNRAVLRGLQQDTLGADRALRETLRRCREVDCPMRGTILRNMGVSLASQGELQLAFQYYDSALVWARGSGELEQQVVLLNDQAKVAHQLGRHQQAWDLDSLRDLLSDSLLNVEKVRALSDVQEKYQTERNLRQIKELEVQKLDAELRGAELKRTRNIYLFSGIGVVGLALALVGRLRIVHRSRAAIRKEKEVSEGLLHNILPEEVADELRAKGYADAREFEQATILFTDFKGFTAISEQLSPAQLVAEIDACFKAFDAVIEKYRIEKIKTIGDAYMAAGGLPDPAHGSPVEVVLAALELQEFMARHGAEREAAGLPAFQMRVGIHTGPVVAGIVGVKKFAYDIWGDTVNTASRMESSGQVGEVNISEATYELVKDTPGLAFTPRGRVQAKGKGEVEMFFVRRSAEST